MNAFGSVTERFFNVDAMPYDVIDNNVDLARHVGESFMPFAVQGVLEGESAAVAAAGFLGARSSMASLSDVTVDEARKRFNVEATSARDLSESWLKNDLLYRYVFQNHGLEARDSNSAWGLYYREKEALDVAFNKEMLTQWSASATDYQMRSVYFEQKKLMNAKLEGYKKAVGLEENRKKSDDPIREALRLWYELYDSPEALAAAKSDTWDVIEAGREKLLASFTPEQQAAVLRAGAGIHLEIFHLLKPESQQRYRDLLARRVQWIRDNASDSMDEDDIQEMIDILKGSMFPRIPTRRGAIPPKESRGGTRTTGRSLDIRSSQVSPGRSLGISGTQVSLSREAVML